MTGGHETLGVVIAAAGAGRRLGGRKKAFLELLGEPVLLHALTPFLAHPAVRSLVVVLPPEDREAPPAWLTGLDARIRLAAGGATRSDSVRAGLETLEGEPDIVIVHDAARPLVTREIVDRCVAVARSGEGAVAGWPSTDTLKEVGADGRVVSTPDRGRIWRAQTPQAFPREALLRAYRGLAGDPALVTDDASVFELGGGRVRMVEGAAWNLKVTHPDDVPVAEMFLRRRLAASSPADS